MSYRFEKVIRCLESDDRITLEDFETITNAIDAILEVEGASKKYCDLDSYIKEREALEPGFAEAVKEASERRDLFVPISKVIATLDEALACGSLEERLQACKMLIDEGWVK